MSINVGKIRKITEEAKKILRLKKDAEKKQKETEIENTKERIKNSDYFRDLCEEIESGIEKAAKQGYDGLEFSLQDAARYSKGLITRKEVELLSDLMVKNFKAKNFKANKRWKEYDCGCSGYGSDDGVAGCSCYNCWVIDIKWCNR